MKSETSDTIQSIKNLQNEVTAWEGRLTHIKSEIGSLQRQKEALMTEIESIKTRSNQEVENKMNDVRKANSDVNENQKKLDDAKAEFEGILRIFNADKRALEKEQDIARTMRDEAKKTIDSCGEFIRMVREGASKL